MPESNMIGLSMLQEKWIDLLFSVLRWQRESYHEKEFKQYKNICETIALTHSEYKERFFYESALFALENLSMEELTRILDEWKESSISPEWRIKYASIAAELGKCDEVFALLKELLPIIRESMPRDRNKKDLYWLGLEGVVLTGLRICEHDIQFNNPKRTRNATIEHSSAAANQEDGNDDEQLSIDKKQAPEHLYRQRLNVLKMDSCNPLDELEFFQLSLKNLPKEKKSGGIKKRVFDSETISYCATNGRDKDFLVGYQFIRFLETTGMIQHFRYITVVDKEVAGATRRIAPFFPFMAFSAFNRIANKDNGDYELFFSQSIVYEVTQSQANDLIERYLREINWLIDNAYDKASEIMETYYKKTLNSLLEVISRLLAKASSTKVQSVFDLLVYLYYCNIRMIYFDESIRHLARRLFEAMPSKMLCENLDRLLHIPPPGNESDAFLWINPFDYIKVPKKASIVLSESLTKALDKWIERLSSNQEWLKIISLKVLHVSCDFGIMNNNQKHLFSEIVFSKTDDNGLPSETNFFPWFFLELAQFSKKSHDIEKNLLHLYSHYNFLFDINESGAFNPRNPFYRICYSMLISMSLTKCEIKYRIRPKDSDVLSIFNNIKASMAITKKAIDLTPQEKQIPVKKNVLSNYIFIDRIIAEIIVPRIAERIERTHIESFIHNYEDICPFPSTKVFLLNKDNPFPDSLINEFLLAITSFNQDFFYLYSWAILNAYIRAKDKSGPEVPSTVFTTLINALCLKTDDTFISTCGNITAILDYYDIGQQDRFLLLQYLEIFHKETCFSCDASRFPYESRYDYRIAAGGLAARIYKKYIDKDEPLPEILQQWEETCHSLDEFPSLRNKWDGVINSH